jgi:hypothetical protein
MLSVAYSLNKGQVFQRIHNWSFIGFLCLYVFSCNNKDIFNITDFGARPDGKTTCTEAINKAITSCHDHGGGTVIVPTGTFITGTIILLSDVTLHLESGAELLGSTDTSDYLVMNNAYFNEGYNRYGLIYAGEARNIAITGTGTLNGNGTHFMNGIDKPHMGGYDFDRNYIRQREEFMKEGTIFEDGPVSYDFRPGMLVVLQACEEILIRDVHFKDSPEWTMRISDCEDVTISGITIQNNQLIPNSDGIHCTASRNICISDCNIVAGDDAIIVTGFGYGPTPQEIAESGKVPVVGNKTGWAENVTVTNCVLSSRSACIRVGYGRNPIRNLVFSNLVMYASNRGIGVFSRNNSSIENVLFSNIIINNRLHSGHWWGKGEPVHISAIKDTENGNPGRICNIRFSNLVMKSETGILIWGDPQSIIEDVSFDRITLTINRGKFTDQYGGNFDLRPAYPLKKAVFKHDIPALYACYVKNLRIEGFELDWGHDLPPFFTYGIEAEHFHDVAIEEFRGSPAPEARQLAAIRLSDGMGAELKDCKNLSGSPLVMKTNVK